MTPEYLKNAYDSTKIIKRQPIFLVSKRFENMLHKGRHMNNQVCEKVLDILSHQGNANRNHSKLLPHIYQDSQEMKRFDSSKCYQGCGETETLIQKRF